MTRTMIARVTPRPGQEARLRTLVEELAAQVRAEAGNENRNREPGSSHAELGLVEAGLPPRRSDRRAPGARRPGVPAGPSAADP